MGRRILGSEKTMAIYFAITNGGSYFEIQRQTEKNFTKNSGAQIIIAPRKHMLVKLIKYPL